MRSDVSIVQLSSSMGIVSSNFGGPAGHGHHHIRTGQGQGAHFVWGGGGG